MKIITLTKVGELEKDWFWNTSTMENTLPFNMLLPFRPYNVVEYINVNADAIVELKDGYTTTHIREKTYVKRNKIIEFFFGKKYDINFDTKISKDKVTWVKFNNGESYYVAESIDQIKKLLN